MARALLEQLNNLKTSVTNLDASVESLINGEAQFRNEPSVESADEIRDLEGSVAENYHRILEYIQSVSKALDALPEHTGTEVDPNLPSREEVHQLMGRFFKGSIRRQSTGLPLNCGCNSHKIKHPQKGDFVCARYHNTCILMIVLEFKTDSCRLYDPTDIDGGIKWVELGMDDWTPLPTVIPERPTAKWEYSRGSQVLSLWRSDPHTEWTTEFYKALVLERPCDRSDFQSRGYLLDFGDGVTDVVPEQFIVAFPNGWDRNM